MKIEQRKSNFSQFDDDLWLVAEDGETKIEFDVPQSELMEFAEHLIDVADTCLWALEEKDEITHDLREMIGNLMDHFGNR